MPYKDLAQALTDLGASRVELVVATVSTALPHMNAGKVHALAVASPRRTPFLPKLPTVIEVEKWRPVVRATGARPG